MSAVELVWIFIPLIAAIAALLVLQRHRASTGEYAEAQAFKTALPWWVNSIEKLMLLGWAALFSVGAWKAYFSISARSPDAFTVVGKVFVILGIGAIILPMAALAANAVSWVVPVLRQRNEQAFRGHHLSFGIANAGLIKFGAVSVTAGLLALVIATIQPWSG